MAQSQAGSGQDRPEQAEDAVPDEILLARVAGGDVDALAALYVRHQRPLQAYLVVLTQDPGLVEELLQDTLLAVWMGANGFAGRASVRSWLYGIARRRAHAALSRHALHLVPVDDLAPDEVPPAPDSADLALAAAERAELVDAIQRLAPAHREILALLFVHELPYRELAETLSIPVGTVKSRLHAARQALRALLEPESGETTT